MSDHLIERLQKLPEEIRSQQMNILSLTLIEERSKAESSVIEVEVYLTIAADETLTNDTKGKSARKTLLGTKEVYAQKLKEQAEIKIDIAKARIQLEFSRDEFKACQSLALIQAPQSVQINLGGKG